MVGGIRGFGFKAFKERVERLMRENGIRARHKRRYKATTDSKHDLPVAPNLLERHFALGTPPLHAQRQVADSVLATLGQHSA
jgi:putative transposase